MRCRISISFIFPNCHFYAIVQKGQLGEIGKQNTKKQKEKRGRRRAPLLDVVLLVQ